MKELTIIFVTALTAAFIGSKITKITKITKET